jgi:PAS domain S-box-containing protein
MSEGCRAITGYGPEAFVQNRDFAFNDLIPAEERAVIRRKWAQVLEDREIFEAEYPIRTAQGRTHWVWERGRGHYDEDGRLQFVEGFITDITERKNAEAALREEHQYNLQVIQSAQEGVIVYGADLRYRVWNPFMEQISGMPASEVLGRHPMDLFPFLHAAGVMERLQKALAGEAPDPVDFPYLVPQTGKSGWATDTVAPFRNAEGEIIGVIGAVLDISERKQAELALRESEARFRLAMEATSDGLWDWNVLTGEVYYSPAYTRMLGYEPHEFRERVEAWEAMIFPEDREKVLGANQACIEGARPSFEVEYRVRTRDGGLKWILGRGKAVERDERGRALRLIGTHQDITDRKRTEAQQRRLEAQLQQVQKMESLGSLAGGVAHDMNNVLGAILGLASANLEIHPEESPTYRDFETIAKAAIRGGKMVKSLLNFARQSPAEERELDMNAILQEETHLLARTTLAKVRLQLELAPDLRPIRGDASALTHSFMNLCVNGVEAMQDNGQLTLRTLNVDQDWIEVQVEDTGTGMPREILARALDPYFTTKGQGKGTGLGLSMVYSTVKAHHGQLEIQSEPGRGTLVRIRFPACEAALLPVEPPEQPRPNPKSGAMNVLLVDDDELIQSSMLAILGALGHIATAAASGEEALAKLAAGLEPEVVVLDMNMPGLGGAGTLPRLRALRPTLPVLLATGRADQTALDLVAAHPRVTLLSKPFSMKELQQQLEAIRRE